MKFAVIGPTYPFRGGIAHYTTSLVHHLREQHTVDFYSFSRQYPAWLFPGSVQVDPSVQVFKEEGQRSIDALNPLTWRGVVQDLKRNRPDVLVMQWWNTYWLPMTLAVARGAAHAGIPLLFICHHIIEPDSYIRDWSLTTLALRYADGFLVMSEEEYGILRRVFPWKRIRAGYHPLYDCFTPNILDRSAVRAQFGFKPEDRVALFFGFVRRYKGLRYLIEAIGQLPAEYKLLIAGEFWEDQAAYLELIHQLGLEERVVVENRYIPNEQVAPYFTAADLLVLPYTAASQSGVGAIALNYGIPVVATDVGGLAETVLHGETGLIVPPGDSNALAGAIRQYFENGYRAAFQKRIEARQSELSWEALVRIIEKLGSEIATEKPVRRP